MKDFIANMMSHSIYIYLARIRALNILQQIYDTRICPWCISGAEVVVSEPHLYRCRSFFRRALYLPQYDTPPSDGLRHLHTEWNTTPQMVLPPPLHPTELRNSVRSELAALRTSFTCDFRPHSSLKGFVKNVILMASQQTELHTMKTREYDKLDAISTG